MSLNVQQLKQIQVDKKQAFEEIYLTIYNRCKTHIEFISGNSGGTECTYEIPSFILGFPPFHVSDCMEYVLKHLNRQVLAYRISDRTIFISWRIEHIKQDSMNARENLMNAREDTLFTN